MSSVENETRETGETKKEITEAGKEDVEVKDEKEKKDEIWYVVRPRTRTTIDEEGNFEAVFELPGVAKENLSLKVHPQFFDLRGRREHTEYRIAEYFPYEVLVDSVDAKYDNGLLTMKVKFKDPLEDAVEIKL